MDAPRRAMDRIDELTLRERAIVFGGVLTLLFLGWYTWLMEPLIKEHKAVTMELQTKREQFAALNEQFVKLADKRRVNPNAEKRKRVAELRRQAGQLQEELRTATENLVDPALMPDLLRAVLKSSSNLQLVRLSGLGSSPLLKVADAGGKKGTPAGEQPPLDGAYRHGIRIEFQGDYFATLEYLRRLEGLEWRFFWDSVHFEVREYPEATTSIEVSTLSLSREWIGT